MSTLPGVSGSATASSTQEIKDSANGQKSKNDPLQRKVAFVFAVAMATVLSAGTVGFLGAIVGSVINIHQLALAFYIGAGAGSLIPVGTVLVTELSSKSIRKGFNDAYDSAAISLNAKEKKEEMST